MSEEENTNRMILSWLITAPDSQVSEQVRKECKQFNGTDEELKLLFKKLYDLPLTEVSSFVKAAVNPEFTSKY